MGFRHSENSFKELTDPDALCQAVSSHAFKTLSALSETERVSPEWVGQPYKVLFYTILDVYAYVQDAEGFTTKETFTDSISKLFGDFLSSIEASTIELLKQTLFLDQLNPILTLGTAETVSLLTLPALRSFSPSESYKEMGGELLEFLPGTGAEITFNDTNYFVVENMQVSDFYEFAKRFNESHPRHNTPCPTVLGSIANHFDMQIDFAIKVYGGKPSLRVLCATVPSGMLNPDNMLLCAALKIGHAEIVENAKGEPTLVWADSPD